MKDDLKDYLAHDESNLGGWNTDDLCDVKAGSCVITSMDIVVVEQVAVEQLAVEQVVVGVLTAEAELVCLSCQGS